LIEDQYFSALWPQFKDDLINSPTDTLAVLSLAMYQVITLIYMTECYAQFLKAYFGILQLLVENVEKDGIDDVEDDLSQRSKLRNEIPYIRARLINYRKITPLKSLRAALFGKLVAVSGTCVRASNTTPLCLALAFQCRTCSGVMTYSQTDGKFEPPPRCILDRDNLQCTGSNFEPLRSSARNVTVEWQSIRIQENSSENLVII
jgi:DNA helicase MCM8